MSESDKSTRANASQFFVAGELCRRGYCAVVTLGNTPNTDMNRPGFSGDFLLRVTQPRLRTPDFDDTPVRTRREVHPRWARAGAGC